MDVTVVDLKLAGEQVDEVRGHPAVHLEADGRRESAPTQLRFQRAEKVLGRVVVQLEVAGAGDPEWIEGQDLHPREEGVEVGRDDILERHEGL